MLARVADQEPGEVTSSQMQNIIVDASPHSSHYYTICSTYYVDIYLYLCLGLGGTYFKFKIM